MYPSGMGRLRDLLRRGSSAPAAPTLLTAPVAAADPRVGLAATGTVATFSGAASVAHALYIDGVKVADGLSYTPVSGDFGKLIELRSTATNAGGSTTARIFSPVIAQFDSMTGADNSAILSHTGEHGVTWVKNTNASYAGDGIIIGNRLGRGATSNLMVWGFDPPAGAYSVEATYTTGSALVANGAITFRASKTAQTFYAFGPTTTTTWGLTKRVNNTVRTSDLVGVGPYAQSPFNGSSINTSSGTFAALTKLAVNTSYAIEIDVWDEGGATQIAVYVNGALIIRVQDADATRITSGVVGWWDTQSAAVTATTGNRVSNMRVHYGRAADIHRVTDTPVQAIVNASGGLDLRGSSRLAAATDSATYARSIGGNGEGGTTDVKVRVRKATGGDVVLDWATPAGLTISGPRWFGTISPPRSRATTNSAGDAWDVIDVRLYRGTEIVREFSSGRCGNGIVVSSLGSSIAAVWANASPGGMTTDYVSGGTNYGTAGLTPNANTAVLPRYAGSYYWTVIGDADYAAIAGRPTADMRPFGWKIAYDGAVGANVFMDRMQARYGGLIALVSGGVGGSGISGLGSLNWIGDLLNSWAPQVALTGGANIITEDFGINEARSQTANAGVLTRADMLGRWNSLHAAVRATSGLASVPVIVKGSPSDSSTAQTSGANNPGNNRRARQAEIDAAAYDSATYRGPPQYDVRRYDGLHPHQTAADGAQLTGARLAEQIIAIHDGTAVPALVVTGATKVSDTQTRFTVSGITDALAARTGVPGFEIATGADLDTGALAVSGAVQEATVAGVATFLVTHASTGGASYRAGYGEAGGQGSAGTSTSDTVTLRDTLSPYPRAVRQTGGGIVVP